MDDLTLPRPRKRRVRAAAVAVFSRGSRILVSSWCDQTRQVRWFRPVGGAIKFGEASVDALRREVLEELGLSIEHCLLLGVLEDRFVIDGEPGHEVVFVYDARFSDSEIYDARSIPFREPGHSGEMFWLDLAKPIDGVLSPSGLEDLVRPRLGLL